MNLNWKAIIIAFVISFVVTIISGIYLLNNVSLIGPIIGGLIAGYIVDGSYTDGLVNGGIPSGIVGLISLPLVLYLIWDKINALITSLGYHLPPVPFLTAAIGAGFAGFAMYFVIGIIGAIIGVAIKNRNSS